MIERWNLLWWGNQLCSVHKNYTYWWKELGPILNHKIIRPPTIQCRRNWSILFVMVVYFEKMMERLNSGEWKIIFGIILCILDIGLTKSGRAAWQEEAETREDTSIVQIHQEQEILCLRALQGHSGRKLIDPSLQDNVLIPDGFFRYIHLVGCAINLHSIINSGLIPGGQNLSKRQTVFFLLVNPMDKEHKDPETSDLKAPRLAQYMHTA